MTLNKSTPIDPKIATLYNKLHLDIVLELDVPRVLIDLDGTLADFKWTGVQNYRPDVIGRPLLGKKDLMWDLYNDGFLLELYTNRLNITQYWIPNEDRAIGFHEIKDSISRWLTYHKFPPMLLPLKPKTNLQKRGCLAVIDDNAINPRYVSAPDILDFCQTQRAVFINGLKLNEVIES